MTDTIELMKKRVLDMAIRGELVGQHPKDATATTLLSRIEERKEQLIEGKNIRREKKLSPITENEIPFSIPENWTWVRLGDIGVTQTGNTPPRKNKEYYNGNVPFIKPDNIYTDYIDYDTEYKLSENGTEKGRVVEAGSILMVCIGTLGKTYITDRKCSFNQQINSLTPFLTSSAHVKYIYYYFKSKFFQNLLWEKSSATTVTIINKGRWNDLVIPLPSIEEQKRIVQKIEEIFSIIDKLAEKKEDVLQTIQLIRETTLQQAIQGKLVEQNESDESAVELIDRIEAEKEVLIKEKEIKREKKLPEITDNEKDFEIPESWEWARLGTISNFSSHQSVKSTDLNSESILIELEDIESNSGRILQKKTVNERKSKSNKYVVQKGNVLYGKLRPYLNKVTIANTDGYCSTEIFPIHFYGGISSEYMMYVLRSPYFVSFANNNSQGTKMPRLGSIVGKKVLIPVPPISEQKRISKKIDQIMDMCDQMEVLFK
jgi:type I restriction enzyme S subunit